jgi:ATP-dependent Clp protease ATP-binding subunit ClpC
MKYIYPEKILKIFEFGQQSMLRLKHSAITPEHIIVGITTDSMNRARTYLTHFGVKLDLLEMRAIFFLTNRYAHEPQPEGNDLVSITLCTADDAPDAREYCVTKDTERLLRLAELEARMLHCPEVGPEHLILAMLKDTNSSMSQILAMYRVNYNTFRHYIEQILDTVPSGNSDTSRNTPSLSHTPEPPADSDTDRSPSDSAGSDDEDEGPSDEDDEDDDVFMRSDRTATEPKMVPTAGSSGTPALDKFGYDISAAAEQGLLDPVVGRSEEIDHVIQALLRRRKNNPILIGEPGVGKTAVVEGLAQRIARREVCWALQNKRIISLDMGSLVAGTKFRGQFEKRLTEIVAELRQNKNIIVFIDEIHTMVGAGSASGTLDAANILKPALSRGEFQCIGSTTFDEFRNSIEKDGALERRFQKVTINPTSTEDTLTILHNLKERYEQHHHVAYTDAALEACVRLTDRYVTDRNFPDKAIDAMDEAGARAHVQDEHFPTEIVTAEAKLREAKARKKQAIEAQEFEDAAMYRESQRKLEQQIDELRRDWEKRRATLPPTLIDTPEVTRVIASISGVPVEKAAAPESERLLQLKDILSRAIIGQQEPVAKIVRAIQRNRVGLSDPNRPIGTFLFVGPTGVGKTLLARTLAREVFLDDSNFIRLDMSEYSEQHAVARMFGAPPGYVGFDKGGQLAEQVRRHPYSVILFDELEKAHPNIYNVLLQILDEGQMTDTSGRHINFKNTIIIMTSNVGSRKLKDFGTGIGFTSHNADNQRQQAQSVIQKEIQRAFSPEFLNRIDDVILFEHLTQADIRRIVDIELDKALRRVRDLGYHIEVDTSTRDFLARRGYDRDLGARPLRRAIQTYIEDELCDTLLQISSSGQQRDLYTIDVTTPEGSDKPAITFHRAADEHDERNEHDEQNSPKAR